MRKPGYKTSEFWFTMVSFIFSGLFLFGIIKENDTKDELIEIVTHGVESIILIGGQLTIFYRYIKSRKQEKIEYEKTRRKEIEEAEEDIKDYVGIDKVHVKININTASVGELIQLPHIGPITAKKIILYRESHGEFQSLEELINIDGIGEVNFEDIKLHILIWG